jgi:hypothetical protein
VGKRHFLVLSAATGVGDDAARAAREGLQAAGFCAALPRRLATGAIEIGFVGALPAGFDGRSLAPALDCARRPCARLRSTRTSCRLRGG